MSGDKHKDGQNTIKPLQKDFAHYPATDSKQVGLDEKPKKDKQANTTCDTGKALEKGPATAGVLPGDDTKIVNGSNKIVNEDEPYSNGSGGAFEATEQVND